VTPARLAVLVVALSAAAASGGCARAVKGPSLEPERPPVSVRASDPEGAWRWFLDVSRGEGPPPAGARRIGAGLVVQSGEGVSLSGNQSSHVLVEADSTTIPVGEGVVRRGVVGPLADPQWGQGVVAVEWLVSARRRGRCAVEICAVPRLLHPCGLVAVLEEARVQAVLELDDAVLIAVDPKDPAADLGRTLVGAGAGRPGRLVFRVRD
jgi:hypothetical protein